MQAPSPLAIPDADELYLFGILTDENLASTVARIRAMDVAVVVLDVTMWAVYTSLCVKLSVRLRAFGIAVVIHTLIHPTSTGAEEQAGCNVETAIDIYTACKATGIYDDGSGFGRTEEQVNALVMPEILAFLALLPWTPVYFATANRTQVALGSPIGQAGFYDWFSIGTPTYYEELTAAIGRTADQMTSFNCPIGVLGWVRWTSDWDDPELQCTQILSLVDEANKNGYKISLQLSVDQIQSLTAFSLRALSYRSDFMQQIDTGFVPV